jgi:hypothetical protein
MSEYVIVVKQDVLLCTKLARNLIINLQEIAVSQRALQVWINQEQPSSVRLIIDLIEEELFVDRLPALYLWELIAYAKRQKARRFPSTEFVRYSFTQSIKLPWQTIEGELWLSGFNEDQLLIELLSWFHESEVVVQGVYSSMSVWQSVLQKTWFYKHRSKSNLLRSSLVLLVRISSQDFRQILFINGFIRTNRLIHLESEMADEQMPILIQEVNLLEKFARSQKILGATEKINIFYLAKDDDECQIALLAFQNSVFSNQSHPRSFVSMQSLVSDVHMSEISGRLMALTLGNAQFKSDYYPKIVQQVEAVKKTTWALWITWTIGVLFLLGYCFSYLTHEYETEKVIHQLNQVEQTHQNYIARYMNNYEVPYLKNFSLNNMKASVDALELIRSLQQDLRLEPILVPISQVLTRFPQVSLSTLSIETETQHNKTTQNSLTTTTLAGERFKQVVMSLIIEVSAESQLSDKIEQVNQLVAALKSVDPKRLAQVNITKIPFTIDSSQPLKFNLEETSTSDKIYVPFELTVLIVYE